MRTLLTTLAASLVLAATSPALAAPNNVDAAVPHYDHVLVIVEENKGYSTILDGNLAPHIAQLAKTYGSATQMYAERHPSEPNYIAMIGGDTFGVSDDDSWYCVPGSTRPNCKGSDRPNFVPHLLDQPSLATQLRAKGLAWRSYQEDIPAPGSLEVISPATAAASPALYASKHNGFVNFASVHNDANIADELVGFDRLRSDLAAGAVPAFSFIVPNQCNDMHGMKQPKAPAGCDTEDGLIRRGDDQLNTLVTQIQASAIWTSPTQNTAVVITWDENGGEDRLAGQQSCCVVDKKNNPGGGRIATIVMTNHGARALSDPTPYNHYSLLRTVEDALGLDGHLRHAGDEGVVPMTPLFATAH
jgi:hypothetical protein